jgi:uncharacterized protein (TIGR00369 family)
VDLVVDGTCFVCGPDNPHGLRLCFDCADGRAQARVVVRPEHQGYAGITHGGILAALLDEVMVYAAGTRGYWFATAELTVRYAKPVPVGRPLRLSGEVTRDRGRLVECRAELCDEAGMVLAHAAGKLVRGPAREEQS